MRKLLVAAVGAPLTSQALAAHTINIGMTASNTRPSDVDSLVTFHSA